MALLLAALAPRVAWCAVQTAGVTTATVTSAGALVVPHTVGAVANRYLLVGISLISIGGGVDATSVIWNDTSGPQASDLLGTSVVVSGFVGTRVTIYGLVAPNNSAPGNVTVNFSGGAKRAVVGVVNYVGVDQTTPGANAFFANGTSTTPSVVVCPSAPARAWARPLPGHNADLPAIEKIGTSWISIILSVIPRPS
jgi:hypothetical protein